MNVQPARQRVEIACRFGIEAEPVAVTVATFLADCGLQDAECIVYGSSIGKLRDLSGAVARSGKPHFRAEVGSVVAELAGVRNYDHTLVAVEADAAFPWGSLVALMGDIVIARAFDSHYDHWQNAEDPLVYRAAGRSMEGLAMKSNGLPFPLEQQVVDISRNPGRRVLRKGYVEAIGHRMWLGRDYFDRVPGADRDAIVTRDWLKVTEMGNGLLEIVASEDPFTNASTSDLQNRLRKLLFSTTA